ncbi:hypothetical protein [Catellatospora citrea]|uniref:Uncharacterized protein n=1 Tax=Catellatospora citrea TaxID=53366 RepID=A0A8J3KIZ4_9ACTN|nr:hypothetical protein [Catellatospora citrea]RKE10122.1 hypothetical protein C8E86_5016 [Catellatospora citrea]GIF97968.1 hypothetical protein Cci01nite_30620 [Catellatospora citrea]
MTVERLLASLKETAEIPIIADPEEHYRSAQPWSAGPLERQNVREPAPETTMIAVSGQETE